jgi:hypothetical protein
MRKDFIDMLYDVSWCPLDDHTADIFAAKCTTKEQTFNAIDEVRDYVKHNKREFKDYRRKLRELGVRRVWLTIEVADNKDKYNK